MKYERTSSSPRMAVEESHEDVKRRGRRVVATTALQPGDAIYATPPDLAVLYSPFAGHICARCLVAEVRVEHKGGRRPPQPRSKSKSLSGLARGSKAPPLCPAGASSSSCVSPCTLSMGNGNEPGTAALLHDPFACPNCDQFVLCASCVGQLVLEVELIAAAAADAEDGYRRRTAGATGKGSLAEHPLLRAHALSCAWYISLPESIRAPGNDTDFLRFCLDYGARVQLGDTAMVAAISKLDTNAGVQSKEAHHLCEVFARDRVVATFGPRQATTGTTTTTATTTTTKGVATPALLPLTSTASFSNARGTTPPSATSLMTGTDRGASRGTSALAHDACVPFPPPYPVKWTDLRDVLLRTRCNSLGFPFTPAETIGWSLQETVCMLNHSCVPNAAVVMLYDADDATRALTGAVPDDAAAAEELERPPPQTHSQRRLQRLSVSPTRASSRLSHSSSGKNMNSFRAIAVSSTSSFSTGYSESLQGWIGIQATRPIAAGEEITVSYIDLGVYGDDVQTRSRHLLEQYRFLCTCELCTRQRGRKL